MSKRSRKSGRRKTFQAPGGYSLAWSFGQAFFWCFVFAVVVWALYVLSSGRDWGDLLVLFVVFAVCMPIYTAEHYRATCPAEIVLGPKRIERLAMKVYRSRKLNLTEEGSPHWEHYGYEAEFAVVRRNPAMRLLDVCLGTRQVVSVTDKDGTKYMYLNLPARIFDEFWAALMEEKERRKGA